MEPVRSPITADSVIDEILERYPRLGPTLMQLGRMLEEPTGHLYAQFPRLTVRDYATLNGLDLQRILAALQDATERWPSDRPPASEHPPNDPIRRATGAGYTSAFHEPGDVEAREVVAVQNRRGPD
jgi:hypothetical protein